MSLDIGEILLEQAKDQMKYYEAAAKAGAANECQRCIAICRDVINTYGEDSERGLTAFEIQLRIEGMWGRI